MRAMQFLRSIRSRWLRSRALARARRTPDADPAEGITPPATDGLVPLARTKLKAMAQIMGHTDAETALRILERTLAVLPTRPLAAYLLPSLSIKRCERIGEGLMEIELTDSRIFTGHRSNQKELFLHQILSPYLPAQVDGNAYKLALDIERRYYGTTLPWFISRGGIYVEGGCFTGMKAVRWAYLGNPRKIVAVEIGAANFDILRANIAANHLETIITPVHAGLWSESGDGVQKHNYSTRRFLETTDYWEEEMRHEERVRLLALGDLLDENHVDVADYVNVQVNGAEIAVLEGALPVLNRIKVIDIAAYYSKDGIKNVDVVQRMLTDAGCTVIQRSELGRITAVTAKFREEIFALKERRDRRRARK